MTQKERLAGILNRFVREDEDRVLDDRAFVLIVFERWQRDQEVPLVDPNE